MKWNNLQIQIPLELKGCRPGHEVRLLSESVELKPNERVAELGSGLGVLSLALAAREIVEAMGFEIQPSLVETARHNAQANANALKGTVAFEQIDLRRLGGTPWEGRFDRVVANPPFFRLGQGRRPPGAARAISRHETGATLEDFVRAAAILLRARGRFHCILKPERLEDMITLATRHRCPVKSIRPVYTEPEGDAEWVLVSCIKGGKPGLKILQPQLLEA